MQKILSISETGNEPVIENDNPNNGNAEPEKDTRNPVNDSISPEELPLLPGKEIEPMGVADKMLPENTEDFGKADEDGFGKSKNETDNGVITNLPTLWISTLTIGIITMSTIKFV